MPKGYDVGYKKPPKHTQFKPGQSGHPKGRTKGAKNLKTELMEELHEMIPIKEDGKAKKVSKQRAMLKALTAKALHGDTRAANTILNMVLKIIHEEDDGSEPVDLTATDVAILKQFEMDILNAAKKKGKKNAS
jgi:hypothetical protein